MYPRAQGMHRDCTDPLDAGCRRQLGGARPSCRIQLPGATGLQAVRAAPPSPILAVNACLGAWGAGGGCWDVSDSRFRGAEFGPVVRLAIWMNLGPQPAAWSRIDSC